MSPLPPTRAAFGAGRQANAVVERMSTRSRAERLAPSREQAYHPPTKTYHAPSDEIVAHLSGRFRSPAKNGQPLPYLGRAPVSESTHDDWIQRRYAKYMDLDQEEADDARREQADARDEADRHYLSLARGLDELDKLALKATGRQEAYQNGGMTRGKRLRDREELYDPRSILDVPKAKYRHETHALERAYREGRTDILDADDLSQEELYERNARNDERHLQGFRDLERSLPSWAPYEPSVQRQVYRDTGGQARLKGHHPAQKPLEPHREARRASERRLDRDSIDWRLDEDEVLRSEAPETHPSGYDPALIAAGLLVPKPKRQQPAEPNWDAFIDP